MKNNPLKSVSMKYTAVAPANIAFIKYWGKKDEKLRLPLNDSISMNLSNCLTTTTVEFSKKYEKDIFQITDNSKQITEDKRVIKQLDRIRKIAHISFKAKVVTQNNFPSSSGIASSASGFAALTLAATKAAGLALSEKELTILARMGSGSACRSVPDGYVIWEMGSGNEDSYAHSLYPANYWDLRDIILVVSKTKKKIGSAQGMENVWSSPLMEQREKDVPERLKKVKLALAKKDFGLLGETIEEDCLNMHKVMQTQNPPLFYWTKETEKIMSAVKKWRSQGVPVYFTIDAGPNVHLICEGKREKEVIKKCRSLKFIKKIIVNKPSVGTRLSKKHLF